jgi:hypothetical protein
MEAAKDALAKEGSDKDRGKAQALKELLDLFAPPAAKE